MNAHERTCNGAARKCIKYIPADNEGNEKNRDNQEGS
jgi:hypothetical protein